MNLHLNIRNPWPYEEWQELWSRQWAVTKHRTLEIQVYRYAWNLVMIDLELAWWGQNHAGPEFEVSLLGWGFRVGLPSNHHWDQERHCWEYPKNQ